MSKTRTSIAPTLVVCLIAFVIGVDAEACEKTRKWTAARAIKGVRSLLIARGVYLHSIWGVIYFPDG
jgi:hypothetical protein